MQAGIGVLWRRSLVVLSLVGMFAVSSGGAATAQTPREDGRLSVGDGSAARAVSVFWTDVDRPHMSGGDVSVHGWWGRVSGSARYARVQVCLQRPAAGGGYRNFKCSDRKTIRPGGGRGRRVTVRHACTGRQGPFLWRGVAEADIVGEADPVQWATREAIALPCSP